MSSKNIFFAAGAFVLVYIVVKLFMCNSGKYSRRDSNIDDSEEITKGKTGKYTEESTKSKVKLGDNTGPMKLLKLRPNFFIAFQVNNVEIHTKVKELQEKLIAKNPILFPALIKVSTLHVTLAVTELANETDIKTVKSKLDEWAEKNVKIFFEEPCVLTFRGVKTFHNCVAYIDIDQSLNYKKISEISNSFNNLLSSNGFMTDRRSFKPHLTFLKLSRDYKLLKFKKNFVNDFEFLKECQEVFGNQEVTSIQLLSMSNPKDEEGYYRCYHEIKVSDTQVNSDHSNCCNPVANPKPLSKKKIKNILGDENRKRKKHCFYFKN